MKTWIMIALTLMVGIGLSPMDAEAAKRLGGGGSTGMQRQSIAPSKPSAPAQNAAAPAAPAAAPAAPAPAGNRWLGPLAGLAAGVGLGYLFSQGGFGGMGGILSSLLIGLLVAGGVMLLMRMFIKPRAQMQPAGPTSYGMMGQETVAAPPPSQQTGMVGGAGGPDFRSQFQPNIPAGFDAVGFVKQAKLSFMNLQKANDTGDLDTLRDMSTDEMFTLFKSQIDSRFGVKQRTEVVTLAADLLEVVTENAVHVASVRFAGMIKEDGETIASPFEEVWNLQKPVSGGAGWMLAGIQQVAAA